MGCGPTGCALAAPPPIDGNHIVADTDAEKGTISLDAKRRPLQARVGRARLFADHCVLASIIPRFIWYRAWLCARATRRAQRRRVPAGVFVPASLRPPSATGVRLHRSRSGPRGASHSHFLMRRCACRAAWCVTGIVWPQRLRMPDVRVVGAAWIF